MVGNGKTRIFAGAGYSVSRAGVQLRGGLFRRSPGDADWQALSAGLPDKVEVRAIAVHPQNPDVIYVGTQDGPYRSDRRRRSLGAARLSRSRRRGLVADDSSDPAEHPVCGRGARRPVSKRR